MNPNALNDMVINYLVDKMPSNFSDLFVSYYNREGVLVYILKNINLTISNYKKLLKDDPHYIKFIKDAPEEIQFYALNITINAIPQNPTENVLDFLDKNINNLDWKFITSNQILSDNFISIFKSELFTNVSGVSILMKQKLSIDFLKDLTKYTISKSLKNPYFDLSTAQFFTLLVNYQNLSEDFIREFLPYFEEGRWEKISQRQKLSEDFIREFQDKVDWYFISGHQTLSEDFIAEFQDKVHWDVICGTQKLSIDFIRRFKDKIRPYSYTLLRNKINKENLGILFDEI